MELMIKTSKSVVLGVICFVSRLEVLEGLKCHTLLLKWHSFSEGESVRSIFIVVSSFTIRVNFAAGLKYILPKWTICSINSNAVLVARPWQAICPWFFNPPIHTDSMTPQGEKMRRCTWVICKVPPSARCHGKGRGCDILREFSEVQQWQTTNSSTCVRSDVFLRWSNQMLRRWALQSRGRWWAWELRTNKRRVTLASRFFMENCLWVKAGEGCEICEIG